MTAGAQVARGTAGGGASPGDGGGRRDDRFPFGPIDEAVHLLDTDTAPWSVQLEAGMDARLDEDRLRRAVADALALHPMARARKVASWPTLSRHRWEVPLMLDVDPLRVLDCAGAEAVDRARCELQSRAVPLAESPPLRMVLARRPAGDLLMLNVNHAAMDGFGALRVLRSIARAYSGEADPVPEIGFDDARAAPDRLAESDLRTRLGRYRALADKLRDLVAPTAAVAGEGGIEEPGYGFLHVALPPSQTQALVELRHRGTVNDLLVAALHRAIGGWNGARQVRRSRIGVLVPANLRPREWRDEVVGNFSLPARISTSRRDRRSPRVALEAVTAQTLRLKKVGMGTPLVHVLARSERLPLWAKEVMVMLIPATGNRLVDTAMLSNLGSVADPPSFGPDGGDVTEMWFSAPARMPLGLSVGAITVGGRLHLSFRYRHRLFDHGAACRFAEGFLAELDAWSPSPP